MGAKFCFFTDPGSLVLQTATQAFGPAGTAGGKDLFRVTDLHTSSATDNPAFAICDGILCAQEDTQGTLTLILKPSETPPFESPVVSYFIYKGVARSSLLNVSDGNILDEDDADATDFTKKIAKEWKKQNADSLTGSRAALGLDRDATFLHDDGTTQTTIFTDNYPIDRLFTYPHKTVQLPTVTAGDLIGSFQSTFGFEIVLNRLGYKPKLAFARSPDNQVSVNSLADDNNGVPWLPDDSAFFAHWHEKEQVLAFLDPCAYFGSFVQANLYTKSGSNATSKVKGRDIYQEILQKFANRNIAWLDIRNNYSYSYNLFGLYDDTVRFASHSDVSQTNDINFRSGSWPILKLQIDDVPGSKKRSLHRTKLCLPVGQSLAPAVLVSKGFVTNLGPERQKRKAPAIKTEGSNPAYYTPIKLAFPATTEGSGTVFIASYTRINIYEKPHAGQPAPATLDVAGGYYLDGVFRLRDLQLDQDYAESKLRFEIFPEEILVDLEGQAGPTYAASVGIAEDVGKVTLFAMPSYFLPNTLGPKGRQPQPSWADVSTKDEKDFLIKLAKTFRYTAIKKKTITPNGSANDVDTILVRHEPSLHHNPGTDKNQIEDYCLLVLPRLDHQALLAQVAADAGADPLLPAFLAVAASQAKRDAVRNVDYVEIGLQSTGFATSGGAKTVRHATALPQKVYEYAGS